MLPCFLVFCPQFQMTHLQWASEYWISVHILDISFTRSLQTPQKH